MSKTLVGLSLVLGLLSAGTLAAQNQTYTVVLSCDKGVTAYAAVYLWKVLVTDPAAATTVSAPACVLTCGRGSASGKKSDRVKCSATAPATAFYAPTFEATIGSETTGSATTDCSGEATNITDPPMGCPTAAAPHATLRVR